MFKGLKKPVKSVFLFFALLFFSSLSFEQTMEIDSLRSLLNKGNRDTLMVMNMKILGYDFYSIQ